MTNAGFLTQISLTNWELGSETLESLKGKWVLGWFQANKPQINMRFSLGASLYLEGHSSVNPLLIWFRQTSRNQHKETS